MHTSLCPRVGPSSAVRIALVRLVLAGSLVGVVAPQSPQLWGQEKPSAPVPVAESKDSKKKEPAWKRLFDGKTLEGWKITDFGGQGSVEIEDGSIVLGMGSSLTGITYQGEFPKCDYEIRWQARRLDGVDFFSTLTFPVQDSFCSFVVGGWAGAVVGISCINYADASENETTRYMKFNKEQWYRMRVAVRRHRIQAWIDDERIVNVDITGRKLATRIEVRRSQPLGIATYATRGAVRDIEFRLLPPEPEQPIKSGAEPTKTDRDSRER